VGLGFEFLKHLSRAKALLHILDVLPADHVIENIPAFQRAVINAGQLAEQDYLVTFGIVPTSPEPWYCLKPGAKTASGICLETKAINGFQIHQRVLQVS
jgi:mannose-1-phosphate guanylyltransferase